MIIKLTKPFSRSHRNWFSRR